MTEGGRKKDSSYDDSPGAVAPSETGEAEKERDPERVAHFRIIERLGQGGMGIVYRAEDLKLRRNIALKVLPRAFQAAEERRRRFLREARSAAAITHPNVATVYEVGEDEGLAYIAMELVEGETLRQRLSRGPLPTRDVLHIARCILSGLAVAHAKGIVHRDLKPDNVMVDGAGNVKILDFGLAKLREREPAGTQAAPGTESGPPLTQGIVGTPDYMAPEQAQGGAIDERTDVFSFGVCLYEMLSGLRPFRGRTALEVVASVLRDTPLPLTRLAGAVPREIEALVSKCLEKRPEERVATARDVLAAFDAAVGEPPPTLVVAGTSRPPPDPLVATPSNLGASVAPARNARQPFLWILAPLVALVVVGAAFAYLRHSAAGPGATEASRAGAFSIVSTAQPPAAGASAATQLPEEQPAAAAPQLATRVRPVGGGQLEASGDAGAGAPVKQPAAPGAAATALRPRPSEKREAAVDPLEGQQ